MSVKLSRKDLMRLQTRANRSGYMRALADIKDMIAIKEKKLKNRRARI